MRGTRSAAPAAKANAVGDATGANATTNWVMAGLFLAAAAGTWWWFRGSLNYDFNSRDFNPLGLVPIVLAAIGVWNLVSAIRGTMVARKFGGTAFAMDGEEVALGETLKGRITTATDLAPTGEYAITIQCVEAITTFDTMKGESRTRDHVRWEAVRKVDPQSVRSSQGIPVEFRLPTTALGIGDKRAKGTVRWVLDVKAPLPGTDFYAIFPVVVRPARG
ncbi:MAG: hypothetical protein IPM22_05135 [Betaproteobacteria bacterium]|nr:hypothetical protein [Betaproteobacteria bacterium]